MVRYYYPRRGKRIYKRIEQKTFIVSSKHPNATIKQIRHWSSVNGQALSLAETKVILNITREQMRTKTTPHQKIKIPSEIKKRRKENIEYYVVNGHFDIYIPANPSAPIPYGAKSILPNGEEVINVAVPSLTEARQIFNRVIKRWEGMITEHEHITYATIEGELFLDVQNPNNSYGISGLDEWEPYR